MILSINVPDGTEEVKVTAYKGGVKQTMLVDPNESEWHTEGGSVGLEVDVPAIAVYTKHDGSVSTAEVALMDIDDTFGEIELCTALVGLLRAMETTEQRRRIMSVAVKVFTDQELRAKTMITDVKGAMS